MVKERHEVALEDRWNVEDLYPNLDNWDKEFTKLEKNSTKPKWPEIQSFKDHLGDNPETLKNALETVMGIERELSKLYTYAHLRHDENIADDNTKKAYNRALSLLHEFQQETSWFEPQLLALPESTVKSYLSSPALKDYHFYLEKIFRLKAHTLTPEKEELLALAGKALQTPHKTFSAINDADFKFGTVLDGQEQSHELTHGTYGVFIREQDRSLRKNAFIKLHGKYLDYQNTLCELLNGEIQKHVFNARARGYSSCLEAALYPKNIDPAVYKALIKSVNDNLGALHQYIKLREKLLGISPLHLYDMYVPLTSDIDIKMNYREGENIVIEAVKPLGDEYLNLLQKGFQTQRWVDRYENKNKRSGGYSSGCYDSFPYILMNYKDQLRDVFTLAHEAGHSMHSLMTHTHQPYQYGDYPIFLAEVASTFNEELLNRLLISRAKTKEEKIFLINQKIEDIRTTFFRQTMFAEFELWLHESAEKNIPLTPKLLKEQYKELNQRYFGSNVVIDLEAEIEWARIPHFYYNFYVFQYATGISAAFALVEKVSNGGKKEQEDYLNFLKSGSSRYPIDTLRLAGVDMTTAQPVQATINLFKKLVGELEQLIGNPKAIDLD